MTRLKFALLYWGLIVIFVTIYCISDGRSRKKYYVEVKGEVIDYIPVRRHSRYSGAYDEMMPQVKYPVGDTDYLFVDHATFRKIGTKPTILYRKDNPEDARIYNILFWIDFGVVFPTFLISGFIFSIILIAITKETKKRVPLTGHFDPDGG